MDLWQATSDPVQFGIEMEGLEIAQLIHAGASPRGMAMLLKAAKVHAWLMGRDALLPEDLHAVFHETVAHRLVFSSMYEMRRTELARELTNQILRRVSVP